MPFDLEPSLTYMGSTRCVIEAVRIHGEHRNKHIGQRMIETAIDYGKKQGAAIF